MMTKLVFIATIWKNKGSRLNGEIKINFDGIIMHYAHCENIPSFSHYYQKCFLTLVRKYRK